MVLILIACFAALSLGVLLIGIGCVKDAFTPTVTERVECGDRAVETRYRGAKHVEKHIDTRNLMS